MSDASDIAITLAWFEDAGGKGVPTFGDVETTSWANLADILTGYRREGDKDGCCFVPARFTLEPDGHHVRRLRRNVQARTIITLDVETHKASGEIPPPLNEAIRRAENLGLAMVGYTSHNHTAQNVRYRLALPLSEEIAPQLPAVELIASALDLDGVIDRSKLNPASLFYTPSAPYDALDHHQAVALPGAPIMADWMTERAGALLAGRQAEADRQAAEAQAEAAARREAKIAAGFNPDDSLIERIRSHFDLAAVLVSHGYDQAGGRYRHPNSESGSFGANIKVIGNIERVFTHNGTDPLHANNLPDWCSVTALDVFDVVTILDFGGVRDRALRELAQRFNLSKAAEKKAFAGLLFRMIRRHASQMEIEAVAFAEGTRQGFSRDEVIRIAVWVADQATRRAA